MYNVASFVVRRPIELCMSTGLHVRMFKFPYRESPAGRGKEFAPHHKLE